MSEVVPLLFLYAFMVWTGKNLPFFDSFLFYDCSIKQQCNSRPRLLNLNPRERTLPSATTQRSHRKKYTSFSIS